MNKRATGKDYRREWDRIQQEEESLKAHADKRLEDLIKKYPDVPIFSDMTSKEISKWGILNSSTSEVIRYIEKIEQWSAEQNPVVQTKIKY
jgi:hypothetical protein